MANDDYNTLFEKAKALLTAKEYTDAIPVFQKLVELAPDSEKREAAMGILHALPDAAKNDSEGKNAATEAHESGIKAALSEPGVVFPVDHRMDHGYACLSENKFDEAVREFEALYKTEPYHVGAKSALCWAYYLLGHWYEMNQKNPEAITTYENLLKIASDHWRAKRNLSSLYLRRGYEYYSKRDDAHARADWEKALEYDQNNTQVKEALAQL